MTTDPELVKLLHPVAAERALREERAQAGRADPWLKPERQSANGDSPVAEAEPAWGEIDEEPEAATVDLPPISDEAAAPEPRFRGLSYAEARRAKIPATNEVVAGLIDAGTVGQVAGLPFSRKSWAARELKHKVAAGVGKVFGRFPIVRGGPVISIWQDDSLAKELERLQLYASQHDYPDDLPLRFLLNEGVQLPDDIDELAGLVESDGAVLLVVDSLYNALAPTVKLKEEEVAVVLAQIKAGICDRTGATVCLVDHAPWPTEGNRGQRRAYGSVFKTAAVRWSIHLEADAKDDTRLHVEASGNNVVGFRRTPAVWDEEALEIRLLDVVQVDADELDARVFEYVTAHPGEATKKVEDEVEGGRDSIRKSLERLASHELVAHGPGRHPRGNYWYPANDAALHSPGDLLANAGDMSPRLSQGHVSPDSPAPRRGGESAGDTLNGSDLEWR